MFFLVSFKEIDFLPNDKLEECNKHDMISLGIYVRDSEMIENPFHNNFNSLN